MPEQDKDSLNDADSIRQFEALFNYAMIGIIVTNHEGKIINFNKYAESQFGYAKDEILGRSVEVLIPGQFHTSHVKQRDFFYQHPEPRRMGEGRDLYALKKDGTQFPVEVSLSYYSINTEMYVIAFLIDITVRKKSEDMVLQQKAELERITTEIKQLNTQLEQKVEDRTKRLRETLSELEKSKEELSEALKNERELGELKSRFVTMASHEFRTPLSTILSSAFLLEKYNHMDAPEQREKHIHRIKHAVAGMKSILEDFLSLGKLEEGLIHSASGRLSAEDMQQIIRNIIQDMEEMLKTGQRVELHCKVTSAVEVDKDLLKNILINLISNAIKFSGEHTVIQVSCETTGQELLISVKDSGIGIPEEDQQHLFERFFRAKNASNIQGTGLGLHIVAKYLELMHGSISMQSRMNEGTSFTIHIPQEIS